MDYSKLLGNILNKEDSANLQVEVAFDKYNKEKSNRARIPSNPTTPGGNMNPDTDSSKPPNLGDIENPTFPGGNGNPDGDIVTPENPIPTPTPPSGSETWPGNTNYGNNPLLKPEDLEAFKPRISTYYDAPLINANPKIVKKIVATEQKVGDGRRQVPPSYHEYIKYKHRESMDATTIRIGDVQFKIPPEFISVSESTPSDSVNSLRQRGSLKVRRGYTRRSITIQLFIDGEEQINGYKVDAPEKNYFVDGLRPLFAQFLTTPFVSITNEFLNSQYDIYTAAVSGIVISTIDGFPGCYEVHLNLEHITLVPYTETPDSLYDEIINWDLYRFNYQRLLVKDLAPISKHLPAMTNFKDNTFKLKILNQEILNGYTDKSNREVSKEIYNDKNFDVMLDNSKQDFEITGISLNASNNIPLVQLSSQNIPTAQYLGSSDVGFNLIIETTDRDTIHALKTANTLSQFMSRQNKEFGTFGFLKVENQFINMTGVEFIVIEDMQVTTVPSFPGLYRIVISCIEYDYRQNDREKLVGMLPFKDGEKGTKNDAITQNALGWVNKIKQDNIIEAKMSKIELYPDLFLPLYDEVNNHLKAVKKFRSKHKLENMDMDYLEKTFSHIPGGNITGSYGLFVDPDYYINYPIDYRDLADEVFEEVKGPKKGKAVTTVGQTLAHGEDLPDGSYVDENGVVHYVVAGSSSSSTSGTDSTSNYDYKKVTGNALADILIAKCEEGCGYIMGTDGQVATSGKWKGKQTFDCSGFISWGLRQLGLMKGRTNDVGLMASSVSTRVSKSELKPGDFVRYPGHIAVFIGDNKTVEAANSKAGVRIGTLRGQYTEFARPKGVPASKSRSSETNNNSENTNARILSDPQAKRPIIGTTVGGNVSSSTTTMKYDVSVDKITALGRHLTNKLKGSEESWVKWGHKYDVNPILVIAISRLETGHGKHLNNNNPSGLMGSGPAFKFNTLDDGIECAVRTIRTGYLNQGLNTITKIGAKYCPPGDPRDVHGTNAAWPRNVASIAKQMAGKEVTDLTYKGFDGVSDKYPGYNGSTDGGSGTTSTIETYKTMWTGKTIGNKVYDLDTTNFGKPIYLESPLMYILKNDKASEEVKNFLSRNGKRIDIPAEAKMKLSTKLYSVFMSGSSSGGPFKDLWDNISDKAGELVGWGLETIKDFGSQAYEKQLMKFHTDEVRMYKTMFTDMMLYSKSGTMCRAFPTYNFLIADESGDWLDGRKLWANYYLYKSVINIEIHQERSQPVHTAKITATNIHHNLNSKKKNQELRNDIVNDPEYGWLVKNFYKISGILLGSPKLTQEMVEVKNKLYNVINLKAGAKIHLRIGYGSNPIMLPIVFNGRIAEINSSDIVEIVAESYGAELINAPLSTDKEKTNGIFNMGSEPTDIIYDSLASRDGSFVNILSKKWGESSKYGIENFGIVRDYTRIKIFEDSAKNYDLMKNVYFARYDAIPFCRGSILFFDGEDNVNFYLYNKTPWDAYQVITQALPEFVCQPMYHQFDCRVFYGLPFWICKYRYDMTSETVNDSAKSFAQFHYVDSLSNIIDNRVICSSRDLNTNCIAMYTLGEGIKSAPTVYSDRTIYPSYQKTKTIDTTLSQDYFGWDFLYEKTIAPVAKSAAIKMAASNLIDAWNRVYSGEVILIGDSSIKPCDYFYINDLYSKMQGLTTVREVVHSISSAGFTTSVYPDMIAINTMKNSSQGNIVKSLTSFGASYGAVKTSRQAIIDSTEPFSLALSVFRTLGCLKNENPELYTALNSAVSLKLGKQMITWVKNGDTIKQFAGISKKVMALSQKAISTVNSLDMVNKVKNLKYVKPVLAGLKGAGTKMATWGTVIAPGIGTIVGWVIGTVIIDTILTSIIDEFSYNNTIKVFPLSYKDGPFISGCSGQADLIAGISETSNVDEKGKKMPLDEE